MKPKDSLYKGVRKFSREQKIFVIECILMGALDRIASTVPPEITFKERLKMPDPNSYMDLGSYGRGALECAGMALGVFYAQLADDGLGIYDALDSAGRFDEACERFVTQAWWDEGRVVERAMKKVGKKGKTFTMSEMYIAAGVHYPNCRNHAICFVDWLSDVAGKENKW